MGANKAGQSGVIAYANALADRYLPRPSPAPAHRLTLDRLNLNTYTYNSLRRAGYDYCDQIEGMTADQLKEIQNIGPFSATEILNALKDASN